MNIWEPISVVFTVRKATLEGSIMLVVIVSTVIRSLATLLSTSSGVKVPELLRCFESLITGITRIAERCRRRSGD